MLESSVLYSLHILHSKQQTHHDSWHWPRLCTGSVSDSQQRLTTAIVRGCNHCQMHFFCGRTNQIVLSNSQLPPWKYTRLQTTRPSEPTACQYVVRLRKGNRAPLVACKWTDIWRPVCAWLAQAPTITIAIVNRHGTSQFFPLTAITRSLLSHSRVKNEPKNYSISWMRQWQQRCVPFNQFLKYNRAVSHCIPT